MPWPTEAQGTFFEELRRDFRDANQGRLRVGFAVTIFTVAVAASGWPHGGALQMFLFWVLVAIPAVCVGMGLAVGELIQARHDRRGERLADDREIRAIRAKIQQDMEARPGYEA